MTQDLVVWGLVEFLGICANLEAPAQHSVRRSNSQQLSMHYAPTLCRFPSSRYAFCRHHPANLRAYDWSLSRMAEAKNEPQFNFRYAQLAIFVKLRGLH